MKKQLVRPLYQQVAIKLAQAIAEGTFEEGQQVNARSTIAQTYAVSAETARRAVQVLVDLGIMTSRHGSGTFVASRDKARKFLEQYENIESINNRKDDLIESVRRQEKEFQRFTSLLDEVIEKTKQSQVINPLAPFELHLTEDAQHLGKSVAELNLWQATGATLVAVSHDEKLYISPGPYVILEENDDLYFVGNEYVLQRMINFFYPKNED